MSEIKVVYKEPGKSAEVRTIENDLHVLQELVGGWIQMVNIQSDVALICNEEGKLLDLQPNVYVHGIGDVVVGPIVFAGVDGEDLTDLPEYELHLYMRILGGD